jgi:hypothetical protein
VYLSDKYGDIGEAQSENQMKSLRQLFPAIALITLSTVIGATSVRAAPETPQVGTTTLTPLLSNLLSIANTIGLDQFSTADLSTLVDPTTTQTTHFGPYASGSSDSGTCGNNWAEDMFDRHFTAFQNKGDGSIVVVEQFKDGSFTTGAAAGFSGTQPSPGGCQPNNPPGGLVLAGIQGSLHGYFVIPIPPGESLNTNPNCNAMTSDNSGCGVDEPGTTTFINTHFSPACYPVTCSITNFFFHYAAGDQGLIVHEWTNANVGPGNEGDIRSFTV